MKKPLHRTDRKILTVALALPGVVFSVLALAFGHWLLAAGLLAVAVLAYPALSLFTRIGD